MPSKCELLIEGRRNQLCCRRPHVIVLELLGKVGQGPDRKRKQSHIDIFIGDVLTMSVPSYKTTKELSIITASLNRTRRIDLRKALL